MTLETNQWVFIFFVCGGVNRRGSFHLQLDSYANFEWISPYYFFHAPWAYLEFISCITQLIVKFLSLSHALGLHLDTFISNLQVKWNYIFQLFEVSPPDKVNSWGYHLRASKRSFVGFYLKCVGGWLGLSGWQTVSSCPADHQPSSQTWTSSGPSVRYWGLRQTNPALSSWWNSSWEHFIFV